MIKYLAALMMCFAVSAQAQSSPGGLRVNPDKYPKEAKNFLAAQKFGDNLPDSQTVYTQYALDQDFATVKMVPLSGANKISWPNALKEGGPGYFVAKIYNIDDKNIPWLGLKAGATGYLWIGELEDGTRGAAIYSVKKDGTIESNPKQMEIGGFCPGQHPYSAVRVTDGKKCSGSFDQTQSATARANQPIIMFASLRRPAFRTLGGGGLWVTCLGGCCEVRPKGT
jgi:hypothetical protein